MSGFTRIELTGKTHCIFMDAVDRVCIINRLSDCAEIWRGTNINPAHVEIPDAILIESGLMQDFPDQFTI